MNPVVAPLVVNGQPHYFAARPLEERMSIRNWTWLYSKEQDPDTLRQIGIDLVAAILPTLPYDVITDRMSEVQRARLILMYANGPGEVVL